MRSTVRRAISSPSRGRRTVARLSTCDAKNSDAAAVLNAAGAGATGVGMAGGGCAGGCIIRACLYTSRSKGSFLSVILSAWCTGLLASGNGVTVPARRAVMLLQNSRIHRSERDHLFTLLSDAVTGIQIC